MTEFLLQNDKSSSVKIIGGDELSNLSGKVRLAAVGHMIHSVLGSCSF